MGKKYKCTNYEYCELAKRREEIPAIQLSGQEALCPNPECGSELMLISKPTPWPTIILAALAVLLIGGVVAWFLRPPPPPVDLIAAAEQVAAKADDFEAVANMIIAGNKQVLDHNRQFQDAFRRWCSANTANEQNAAVKLAENSYQMAVTAHEQRNAAVEQSNVIIDQYKDLKKEYDDIYDEKYSKDADKRVADVRKDAESYHDRVVDARNRAASDEKMVVETNQKRRDDYEKMRNDDKSGCGP